MAREGSLLTSYCKSLLFNVGKEHERAKKVQGEQPNRFAQSHQSDGVWPEAWGTKVHVS